VGTIGRRKAGWIGQFPVTTVHHSQRLTASGRPKCGQGSTCSARVGSAVRDHVIDSTTHGLHRSRRLSGLHQAGATSFESSADRRWDQAALVDGWPALVSNCWAKHMARGQLRGVGIERKQISFLLVGRTLEHLEARR